MNQNALNLAELIQHVVITLSAVGAAYALVRMGISVGKFLDRIQSTSNDWLTAAVSQAESQTKMTEIGLRQVTALEKYAEFTDFIRQLQEERMNLSMTLQVISRDMTDLRRAVTKRLGEGPQT